MIFASNNKDKLKQIKAIFNDCEVLSLKECDISLDVEEDGTTFEENATKKAVEAYKITNQPSLGDDVGLCIDFFDGWPGINTHRFLGNNSTAEERNQEIIAKMRNVSDELRTAKIVCALALCYGKGKVITAKGEIKCTIAHRQQGDNYFGFDSIVQLPSGKTYAMLTDEEKIKLNVRGLTAQKLKEKICELKLKI